jgi:alpha-mannosidase
LPSIFICFLFSPAEPLLLMPQLSDFAPKDFQKLLDKLEACVYQEVSTLEVTVWPTKEPVPFAERRQGEGRKIRNGDAWGRDVFDCAWFLFEGEFPKQTDRAGRPVVLLIDVNGELCLYDEEGSPLAGLTSIASSYDFRLGKPGKRVFWPPKDFTYDGKFRVWADGGYNDLFGLLSGNGMLIEARVALCDESARELYYDVAFLFDYFKCLAPEAPLARRLVAILREVEAVWQPGQPDSAKTALQTTAKFFAMQPGRGLLEVTATGHAHLDLAWLWPTREGKRKAVRTLSTALCMAERYPEYRFCASQAQLFAWIKESEPVLFRRVAEAVRRGNIEPVGDAWVESDTNMPSGESLIRQIHEGRVFFQREFGIRSEVMFLPDVFGYSAALPQIMQGCGLKYFMTQKLSWNINRFPHHTFWWEGLDGTRVLAHMLPEETYNSPASPGAVRKLEENYSEIGINNKALMLYGIGDGGGGPGEEHLENVRRLGKAFGLPNVKQGRVGEFFTSLAESITEATPIWRGELYMEKHQGTLTTHADIKRSNRRAEVLLREVEWLLAAEIAMGGHPCECLTAIWRDILHFQFHDILPGSSIQRVYEDTLPVYRARIAELETIRENVSQRFAQRMFPRGEGSSITVANSLTWERKEWVRHGDAWFWCEVPALSVSFLAGPASVQAMRSPVIEGHHVSNGIVEFTLGANGGLESLRLAGELHEFVMSDESLGTLRIYHDDGNAWDTPLNYRTRSQILPELVDITPFHEGPNGGFEVRMRLGESSILQRISLRSGSPLVIVENEFDWHFTDTLVRAVFPAQVPHGRATYEIQFGYIERANHNNTAWDAARHECPHQQWVDFSNRQFGLTVINEGKYGSVLKEQTIELSLLRSVRFPQFGTAEGECKSEADSCYSGIGLHACRYGILPHIGDHHAAAVWRYAREFNNPLHAVVANVSVPPKPAASLFEWSGDSHFELSTFKPSDSGKGVVARIVRLAETEGALQLLPNFPIAEVWETNLLEEPTRRLESGKTGFALDFKPFEVKTLFFGTPPISLCP